jgi:hypothetical protein
MSERRHALYSRCCSSFIYSRKEARVGSVPSGPQVALSQEKPRSADLWAWRTNVRFYFAYSELARAQEVDLHTDFRRRDALGGRAVWGTPDRVNVPWRQVPVMSFAIQFMLWMLWSENSPSRYEYTNTSDQVNSLPWCKPDSSTSMNTNTVVADGNTIELCL